jgi:hypothetical protein
MPRSLRWIASITTGIVTQFVFQIAFLALVSHAGKTQLRADDPKVAFGSILATIVNLVVALAVNDWLAARYPIEKKTKTSRPVEDLTPPPVPKL